MTPEICKQICPFFWVGGGGVNNSRLNFSNKIIYFGVAPFPLTCCCCDQIDDWEKNCKTEIENLNECERRRGFNVRSSLWRLPSSSQCWWSSHLTGDRLLRGKPQGELQLWSWTPPYNHSYGILIILSSRSSLPSPSCCHQVYIFMFNIGYGSLVWMTATEILPAKIRSSTNGLTVDNISVTISFDRCPHPQNENLGGSHVSPVGYSICQFCIPLHQFSVPPVKGFFPPPTIPISQLWPGWLDRCDVLPHHLLLPLHARLISRRPRMLLDLLRSLLSW